MRPIVLISVLAGASISLCQATTVGMASSGNYAVLGVGNNTVINNQGTVNGSLGVSDSGPSMSTNNKSVNGNVVDANASWFSNKGTVTGQTSTSAATLAQNISDAKSAYTSALSLTPTQTVSGVYNTTTLNGNDGLNVISVAGNITRSLTLNGSSNSFFVVLVDGTLALGANQSLGISGGVSASHVMYVFDGPNGTVTTSTGDTINGTLLAPAYSFTLNGTLNGALIGGGQNITLMNAIVNSNPFVGVVVAAAAPPPPPPGVPEPATYLMAGVGFLALGGLGRLSRKRA